MTISINGAPMPPNVNRLTLTYDLEVDTQGHRVWIVGIGGPIVIKHDPNYVSPFGSPLSDPFILDGDAEIDLRGFCVHLTNSVQE